MSIRLHIPGFVDPDGIYLFGDYPWIACYLDKQLFLGRRFQANPTQVVSLDELKVGGLLAWKKGSDDKLFLQYKCFGYKARPCFTSYHISGCHIGSDCLSKRQDPHLLNACVTRRHTLVIAGRQDYLHGHACTQQDLYDVINPGRSPRTSLKKDGKYIWIKIEGRERFTSPAGRDC